MSDSPLQSTVPSADSQHLDRIRLDESLQTLMDEPTRTTLWQSIDEILTRGPIADTDDARSTGLALGYVQSGKTTAITGLIAAASDQGYRVIVALLGSTNLLLAQNTGRIEVALGIDDRRDYKWRLVKDPKGARAAKDIQTWLTRGRTVLIPLLKHSGRINALAEAISLTDAVGLPTLIVDDEADQASLNTTVNNDSTSRTYAALKDLRRVLRRHLYVQFTATPYAPLLLDMDDHLLPEFVTFLHPGPGYTGGREFFVDSAESVIRPIPAGDEQTTKVLPVRLPKSLESALANFLAGAALLLGNEQDAAPISMLIHSTQRNDVQARYHFLVERQIRKWASEFTGGVPEVLERERQTLVGAGAKDLPDDVFSKKLHIAIGEATAWLVNSESALKRIDWNATPVHILVGGNKLDRGFTVEGLTVTYMNRPASQQVDTLEQRARAFGYRGDLLPYCQFFATPRTLAMLRDIVFTEYDLRARLRDWVDRGGSVHSWAQDVGLLLPKGTKPTRSNVIGALQHFNASGSGWHSLRRPSLDPDDKKRNHHLLNDIGLLSGARADYGRLAFRTIHISLESALANLLRPWRIASYSPGWRHEEIIDYLERIDGSRSIPVVLLDDQNDLPRTRAWDELGFVNLFQGRDNKRVGGKPYYPRDREVPHLEKDTPDIAIQAHHVKPRNGRDAVYTLAINLGDKMISRKVN